jgi:hypothetical protein
VKKPASKAPRANGSKIWVAYIGLAYAVVGAGTTEREAINAACRYAAQWLNSVGALDSPWTAKRVEEEHGVSTYHVPIGGAVQS